MRLRKIPRAQSYLQEHNEIVVTDLTNFSLNNIFPKNQAFALEIGCGKGQFIINMAKAFPDINFIALEKYDSVLLRAVEKYEALEDKPTNLIFVLADFMDFQVKLEPRSISTIYLNFSDPWPKNRQAKRRLTHLNFLKKYQEILKENGEIIQKTDNKDLFDFSLEQYDLAGFLVYDVSYDLHKTNKFNIRTEFEDKWSIKGPIYYARVRV